MGDPYSRYQSQTHEDCRGAEDCPIETEDEGTEIPVARGGYRFALFHGKKHSEAGDSDRTTIAVESLW